MHILATSTRRSSVRSWNDSIETTDEHNSRQDLWFIRVHLWFQFFELSPSPRLRRIVRFGTYSGLPEHRDGRQPRAIDLGVCNIHPGRRSEKLRTSRDHAG